MKQLITLLLLLVFQFTPVTGQTDKKIEKAVMTFNDGKIDKAIAMMQKIADKDPSDANWNLLVNMYYYRFSFAKENEAQALIAVIGETLGAKMKHEDYTSSRVCFDDLISKCREAGLYSQSTIASQLLRNFFIDYAPDTEIAEEADDEFRKAEGFFANKDFENAKIHYQNALNMKPDFYKATIYLGDSYWYIGEMDSAIFYFKRGIEMNPDLLEPRKYLVDALGYSRRNEEAKKECIEAICIYPDESMFIKYADLLKREEKNFNKHWVRRGCGVNTIGFTETKTKNPIWAEYQEAKNEIKSYCDSSGVITKPNTLTESKYMEVYSWEKMLNSTSQLSNDLIFAKNMADQGFLDCYVFISVFHFDVYDQYIDFVKNNKDRIKTYVETYLED